MNVNFEKVYPFEAVCRKLGMTLSHANYNVRSLS